MPPEGGSLVRLVKGTKRYLNVVAVIDELGVKVEKEGADWPLDKTTMFLFPGDYIFEIVLSGSGSAPTEPYVVKLTYTGNWATSDMSVVD